MNKNIWIVVLVVLLVGAFGYIGFEKYSANKQAEQLSIFEQGAAYGYTQAVTQVAQMAVTCEQVPLNVENTTINMIAVDCLTAQQ